MSRQIDNPGNHAGGSSIEETRRIDTLDSVHDAPAEGVSGDTALWDEAAVLETHEKSHTGRTVLLVLLIVFAAAACVLGYFWLTQETAIAGYDDQTQILDDGNYYQGVSILGVDVSGMSLDQAREVVNEKVQTDMNAMSVVYTVEDESYELGAKELGASIDVDALLQDALAYGRTGSFADRQSKIADARNSGKDFVSPYSYDGEAIAAAVKEDLEPLAQTAKDATVEIKTVSDEANKITDYEIAFTDEQSGIAVDEEKLVSDLLIAANAGAKQPVAAKIIERDPEVTKADLEAKYAVRSTYSTEYGSSAEGRRYNIWKMADVINGVEIKPGDTWSINDEAGPRTYELGWKGAPGISDGEYQEEAGGGICQVSSTLYNAVLRGEITVAERTHHSWPLTYVPGGLDATISTGAPDFKITNNLDVPIYIATRCDGEGDRTVEVSIIGPKIEDGLTRDFYSELVKTTPAGSAITVSDSSLPSGETRTIIGAHEGKTYNVYKRLLDENGNQVGETELYMVDTYAPKPAKIRVGTGSYYYEPEPEPEEVYEEPPAEEPEPSYEESPEPETYEEPAPEPYADEGGEGYE